MHHLFWIIPLLIVIGTLYSLTREPKGDGHRK